MNENIAEDISLDTEKEAKKLALLEESRAITEKIRDLINQQIEHSEETVKNTEIPTLDKRLIEIDKEIHELSTSN